MINFITQVFSGRDGKPSSTRVSAFLVVAVVLFNWTYLSIIGQKPVELGQAPWAALVGAMAVKSWQSKNENQPKV